jgi:hypothetical protein
MCWTEVVGTPVYKIHTIYNIFPKPTELEKLINKKDLNYINMCFVYARRIFVSHMKLSQNEGNFILSVQEVKKQILAHFYWWSLSWVHMTCLLGHKGLIWLFSTNSGLQELEQGFERLTNHPLERSEQSRVVLNSNW